MVDRYWDLPYPSRRSPVMAERVVATSQPLAAQAGLEMLRRGGNAVDAAVAAAAALTVVEPTSNGIGSDAFAIVWDGERLHGLNASGRSPARLDADRFLEEGRMPTHGWDAVTVPGAPSAWASLQQRFCRLGLDELLEPAARYAEAGWLVGPVTAAAWEAGAARLSAFEGWSRSFLPGGSAPRPGRRFALPEQARTLRRIGATGGEDAYRGETGARIAAAARAAGAMLDEQDLAGHHVEWVTPLTVETMGVEVVELPPNGQGVAALEALGILARTPAPDLWPYSPDSVHWQVESMKAAFADAYAEVADPAWMRTSPAALLDPSRLEARAACIRPDAASDPGPDPGLRGGTVYLTTADADGRMVSYIQSNYMGFGSGVVVDGTGVALGNRGACFTTEPGHPNAVAGGKRPFHTIIPAMASRGGTPFLSFGVMGGHMQPQGHLQVLLRLLVAGENPQAVVDAPRWRVDGGRRVLLERGWPGDVAETLAERGHDVVVEDPSTADWMFGFGGAQLVNRLDGGWLAASDPRKEGQAVGF